MTWRRLLCLLAGHRPVRVPWTIYAICGCCGEVRRFDDGRKTFSP